MFCQQCGSPMRDTDAFCGQCGAKAPENPLVCPQCGYEIEPDDVFCMECGAKLEKPPAPDPDKTADLSGFDRGISVVEPLVSEPIASRPEPAQVSSAPESSKTTKVNPYIIAVIVGVVVIAVAAIVAFTVLNLGSSNDGPSSNQNQTMSSSEDNGASSPSSDDAQEQDSQKSLEAQSETANEEPTENRFEATESSEYVLPDSNSRYYSREELEALSDWDLYIARNEIYARHGRGFSNADLKNYFGSCSWYVERYSPEAFDAMASPLNDYERKNADLMLAIEKERNSSYLTANK